MTGSVLVVGGGIAGRAVARVLARHGLGCTVVERRESVGRGMGVNLPGNAVRALAELGVPDQALASGVPVRRREYRNGRGRLLFAVDDERFWREVGRPVCVRHGDLLDALALPAAATLEHARAVGRPTDAAGVEVELEGAPSPRHFDFVIGADGVHSAMREAVAVDGSAPVVDDRIELALRRRQPRRRLLDGLVRPGRDLLADPGRGGPRLRVRRPHPGRGHRIRPLLVGAGGRRVSRRRSAPPSPRHSRAANFTMAAVDEVRLERWHNGRLVLIGDAAHATGPVWAQGVAMALEDALVLGELLALTPAEHWSRCGA